MVRNLFPMAVFIGFAFCLAAGSGYAQQSERPNLLFIFPDQFQAHTLAYKGDNPVKTPNLDRFAEEAMVFTNAVSNRPLCSPYRAMLMTGRYPFSNGVLTNSNTSSRKFGNYLREDANTFSDALSQAGYYSGYIGKWHLDAPKGPDVEDWREAIWDTYTPQHRRHSFDFWYSYGTYDMHLTPHYWVNNDPVEDTTKINEWSPTHEVDVATDFIKRNKDKPWALFVSMNPPHPPYHLVPDKYRKPYLEQPVEELVRPNVPEGQAGDQGRANVKNYYAMVTGVDEQIGRLLDNLGKEGEANNTIVVFTTDHGELMGSHGRMQKVAWYEESMNVPFFVRWPDRIQPGIDSLNIGVPDVMPSLLSLMGLKNYIPDKVEGTDYSPIMLGEESPELIRPDYSLYFAPSFEHALGGLRGLRNGKYTFVVERNNQGEVEQYILHDNVNDPYQLENIADQNPALVKKLEGILMDKLAAIDDPWIVFDPDNDQFY